jgi:hypothetical protein
MVNGTFIYFNNSNLCDLHYTYTNWNFKRSKNKIEQTFQKSIEICLNSLIKSNLKKVLRPSININDFTRIEDLDDESKVEATI